MQKTSVIIAIDTALGPCSVAIVKDGKIAASEHEPTHGKQSSILVPMIESVLADANIGYQDLHAVACTIGPGGFTGIRVGLTTARAIALAARIPLIGLSTLETIAYGAQTHGDLLAVIDAYRGQFYAQRFRCNGSLVAQSDALLVDAKILPSLAHGAKKIEPPVNARDVALLAYQKWEAGERDFPNTPLYIREPDAKLPESEGLKCAGNPL